MRNSLIFYSLLCVIFIKLTSCKVQQLPVQEVSQKLPTAFANSTDTNSIADINWKKYFDDDNLNRLIDTALMNNQEINLMQREIAISQNEIMARKGEYKPFVNLGGALGTERAGRYTLDGVGEEDLKTREEKVPRFIGDQMAMASFSWETDIWKKLHNAKKASALRYLESIEGRNFSITNLIAEIATSYYELIILDNQLDIVEKNITIQANALEMVKAQKDAARVNQLAVNRFEAQLINTQNLKYAIRQEITETENRINFLVGRFPQSVKRNTLPLDSMTFDFANQGIPSQLLRNRPDIRQAEIEMQAAKIDIDVAKANFYPNVTLRAGLGFQSFNPVYLIAPKSIAFNLLGDIVAPLVNKNAIKANYYNAGQKQIQSVIKYEQTVLNAYVEVVNKLSGNKNYAESFTTKSKQVDILSNSIEISNNLFKSAKADYTEVLLTQREALEAKMELLEIKRNLLQSKIHLYRALGGGWK